MRKCFVFLLLFVFGVLSIKAQSAYELSALQRLTYPIYRKATKEELKTIAPKPQLFQKYRAFLKQSDTGLTRLAADAGCAESTKVVVATEDCMKYTMPGAGFAYSFRVNNYRIPRLADIIFTDNSFQAAGVLLHGIFVNVGDVPLDKISLQTNGLKFLLEFQPEPDYEKAKEIDIKLAEGIENDGFLYRRGLYIQEETTFVLRSVAYDGAYFRAINNITYNEFRFDKRRDIVVAFRIVEKGADNSVTILWKELLRKKSPKVTGREDLKKL
jgi:hypothetical protein